MQDKKVNSLHYWVYILHCDNGNYYTGYTTNLLRRYQEHMTGTDKCKYTRSFKPVGMAQCWQVFGNKSTAMKVENFIKQLSRQEKQQLLLTPEHLSKRFNCKPFAFSYRFKDLVGSK